MKITENSKNILSNVSVPVKEDRKVLNTSESFEAKISKIASGNYEEKIALLLEQIEQQGEKLLKKVDIADLKAYKRLVTEFLDQAVNNSHKFMKENKLDRRGRHRVYAIIKRVNENLENLTQEVLKEEKDNLQILQRLDDIRGLLLDIST